MSRPYVAKHYVGAPVPRKTIDIHNAVGFFCYSAGIVIVTLLVAGAL